MVFTEQKSLDRRLKLTSLSPAGEGAAVGAGDTEVGAETEDMEEAEAGDMEEAEAGDMEEEEEGQGLAICVERRVTCRENVPREVAGVEGVVVDMVEAVEDMEVEGVVVAMEEEDMGEAVVATNQIKDLLLRFF